MGGPGGFLRHSSGGGGPFQPSGAGWVGCGWREHSLVWNQETGGRRRSYRWSCCPEPGSESRFRIPAEPGAAAWWGEILLSQFSGSLTIRVVHSFSGAWALGFQSWDRRCPEEKCFKYTRGDY